MIKLERLSFYVLIKYIEIQTIMQHAMREQEDQEWFEIGFENAENAFTLHAF